MDIAQRASPLNANDVMHGYGDRTFVRFLLEGLLCLFVSISGSRRLHTLALPDIRVATRSARMRCAFVGSRQLTAIIATYALVSLLAAALFGWSADVTIPLTINIIIFITLRWFIFSNCATLDKLLEENSRFPSEIAFILRDIAAAYSSFQPKHAPPPPNR